MMIVDIITLADQTVEIEDDILFSNNGIIVGSITHTASTSEIKLGSAGNYAIWFFINGTQPNQYTLFQNDAAVDGSLYGAGSGNHGNSGMVIITAAAGDILTLRNHTSSSATKLQTSAGGKLTNVSASILIEKIS